MDQKMDSQLKWIKKLLHFERLKKKKKKIKNNIKNLSFIMKKKKDVRFVLNCNSSKFPLSKCIQDYVFSY